MIFSLEQISFLSKTTLPLVVLLIKVYHHPHFQTKDLAKIHTLNEYKSMLNDLKLLMILHFSFLQIVLLFIFQLILVSAYELDVDYGVDPSQSPLYSNEVLSFSFLPFSCHHDDIWYLSNTIHSILSAIRAQDQRNCTSLRSMMIIVIVLMERMSLEHVCQSTCIIQSLLQLLAMK